MQANRLITETQVLIGAKYVPSGYAIPVYDDGFGKLWILRDTMGILGICRARSWADAYAIAKDEFFREAEETLDELIKEYGFRREHVKIVRDSSAPNGERPVQETDYVNGRLPDNLFLRWAIVQTLEPNAWSENELFQEAYGFRPNGPNHRDKLNHGIYSKDLNGECLELLTAELLNDLGIELIIEEVAK